METTSMSFVEKIEDFIQGIIKLVKAFLALLGIDFTATTEAASE